MTDFETLLLDNSGRIYRYWTYKRMFTPLEQDMKYIDQSCYEIDTCSYGIIKEAVELPDGDILLGFIDPYTEADSIAYGDIDYHKLSEILLNHCPSDMEDNDD